MSIFKRLRETFLERKSTSEKPSGVSVGDSYESLKQDVLSSSKKLIACSPKNRPAVGAVTASRFGGRPAWPKDQPPLAGQNGKPMIFLAQINFEEAPPLEGFPDSGLLQFFVDDDDVNGCEFPSRNGQGCAIIYRERLDGFVLGDQYRDGSPECSPFQVSSVMVEGRDLVFETGDMHPSYSDVSVTARDRALYRTGGKEAADEFYQWMDAFESPDIYLGGFPKFTQNDVRELREWRDYDTVLLQLGVTDEMMWGDCGEACFLMRKEDLIAKRFENAIYNWDCG